MVDWQVRHCTTRAVAEINRVHPWSLMSAVRDCFKWSVNGSYLTASSIVQVRIVHALAVESSSLVANNGWWWRARADASVSS